MQPAKDVARNKYTNFPTDYRNEEITTVLDWIRWGESGVVIGGSGTGKSNIAGYLASRSDVTSSFLPEPASNYLFMHLDFNELAHLTTQNFYRYMLYLLQSKVYHDEALSQRLDSIVSQARNPEDTFALYMTVRAAHGLIIDEEDKHVIWLLDRFEKGCPLLEAETLNSLRNLRDQHKDRLSFIAFSRHSLSRLRAPSEYDEFHEIMIMHTCFVGPMNWRDGQWAVKQVEKRYQTSLHEVATKEVYDLCGGLPTFLKISYSALAAGEFVSGERSKEWAAKIQKIPAFQRSCQEIWDSYNANEQAAMRNLALNSTNYTISPKIREYLSNMGLLKTSYNGEAVELFSTLFAEFVRQQNDAEVGIVIRGGEAYCNGLLLELTKREFTLLQYCSSRVGEVCTKEKILQAVWPGEEHYEPDDERLSSAIKHVRAKIKEVDSHQYIANVRGRGFKFVQRTAE